MKVYRRSEFMKLPEGTIYAKGKPWFFGDITVKGDTFGNDWTCLSPMSFVVSRQHHKGEAT